jgi:hypothetical protein
MNNQQVGPCGVVQGLEPLDSELRCMAAEDRQLAYLWEEPAGGTSRSSHSEASRTTERRWSDWLIYRTMSEMRIPEHAGASDRCLLHRFRQRLSTSSMDAPRRRGCAPSQLPHGRGASRLKGDGAQVSRSAPDSQPRQSQRTHCHQSVCRRGAPRGRERAALPGDRSLFCPVAKARHPYRDVSARARCQEFHDRRTAAAPVQPGARAPSGPTSSYQGQFARACDARRLPAWR